MTSFTAKPDAVIAAGIYTDPRLTAFLGLIGKEAERHVTRLAPAWITRYPEYRIVGGTRRQGGRPVAFVDVRSPFWHLPEFGSVRSPMTPYLRPGALAAINNRGGRLKEQPK